MTTLHTDRLILRRWASTDHLAFARMNRDPAVMEFYPATLSLEETCQMVERAEAHFDRNGFGPWAAELRETGEFIGYIGLLIPRFEAAFTPCVEIGWRLAAEHWGKGLATEGARAAVRYAFETLALKEIVSFTVPANLRSRRVMEKLGMTHDLRDDFDHPLLPLGYLMQRHVLYRLARPALP
jgi:RimJ/RimL family protein N-acetyltransferase